MLTSAILLFLDENVLSKDVPVAPQADLKLSSPPTSEKYFRVMSCDSISSASGIDNGRKGSHCLCEENILYCMVHNV